MAMEGASAEDKTRHYGVGRSRVGVSYADVERAAITLLKSSRRPTIETLRERIGHGSPSTLGTLLSRFWRDLGLRVEGDPVALSRLPAEVAELADGLWQRALTLAAQAAGQQGTEARARLHEQELRAELRAESFYLREREWDQVARERERALAEARDHLLATIKSLTKEQARTRALEARIVALESQSADYRAQVAALVASAITKHQMPHKQTAAPRRRGETRKSVKVKPSASGRTQRPKKKRR
jgi:hypothetical protein